MADSFYAIVSCHAIYVAHKRSDHLACCATDQLCKYNLSEKK